MADQEEETLSVLDLEPALLGIENLKKARAAKILESIDFTEGEIDALTEEVLKSGDNDFAQGFARILGTALPALIAGVSGRGDIAGPAALAGATQLETLRKEDREEQKIQRALKGAQLKELRKKKRGQLEKLEELDDIDLELAEFQAKEQIKQPFALERAVAGKPETNVSVSAQQLPNEAVSSIGQGLAVHRRLDSIITRLKALTPPGGKANETIPNTLAFRAKGVFADTDIGKIFAELDELTVRVASIANRGRPTDKDAAAVRKRIKGDISTSYNDLLQLVTKLQADMKNDVMANASAFEFFRGGDFNTGALFNQAPKLGEFRTLPDGSLGKVVGFTEDGRVEMKRVKILPDD